MFFLKGFFVITLNTLNLSMVWGAVGFITSTFLLMVFAKRLKLLDYPGGRKCHLSPTPVIGGLCLYVGFTSALLSDTALFHQAFYFWAFAGLIVLIGVIDDRHEASARTRLIVQTVATFGLVYFSGVQLENLGALIVHEPIHLHWLAIGVSILFIISFLNAMNMLDGIDGLVGGIALGQASLLWILSARAGSGLQDLLSIFIGLMVCFLFFNVSIRKGNKAKIFLGDAGSTFIAFFLIWVAISLSQQTHVSSIKPITVLWCVLFPFMDLVTVCVIRYREGKPCTLAGHDHIHHILMRRGISPIGVTLRLSLFSLGIGLVGLVFQYIAMPENAQFFVMVCLIFAYVVKVNQLYYREKILPSEKIGIA